MGSAGEAEARRLDAERRRDDMISVRPNPGALEVDCSPGNGTRYALTYVERPGGCWLVIWDAVGWMGRVYGEREVRHHAGRKLGKGDLDAIEIITAETLPQRVARQR